MTSISVSVNGECQVPPGFRFQPTEEELLLYYLRKRVSCEKIDLDIICDIDLNKFEPWDIQDMHWLVNGDTKDLSSSFVSILSFDFKKEEFYWTPHPAALEKKPSLWNFLHVLNFKGSSALVEFSSSEDKYMKIWALKNNYGNKEWVLNYKIDA
ncbi:unnamed protein product [Prunus brigantina]